MAVKNLPKVINVKIKPILKPNTFGWGIATINSNKEVKIVTNGARNDIIRKCSRYENNINTIEVKILKVWNKITY